MKKIPSLTFLRERNFENQVSKRINPKNFLNTERNKIKNSRIKTEPFEPESTLPIIFDSNTNIRQLESEIVSLYLNEKITLNTFKSRFDNLKAQDPDKFSYQQNLISELIRKERLKMCKKIKESNLRNKECLYLMNFFKAKSFENDIIMTKIFNDALEKDTIKGGLRTFLNSVESTKKISLINKELNREMNNLQNFREKICRSIDKSRMKKNPNRKNRKSEKYIKKKNMIHFLPNNYGILNQKINNKKNSKVSLTTMDSSVKKNGLKILFKSGKKDKKNISERKTGEKIRESAENFKSFVISPWR